LHPEGEKPPLWCGLKLSASWCTRFTLPKCAEGKHEVFACFFEVFDGSRSILGRFAKFFLRNNGEHICRSETNCLFGRSSLRPRDRRWFQGLKPGSVVGDCFCVLQANHEE